MSQDDQKRARASLQAVFRPRGGATMLGKTQQIGKTNISFASPGQPARKQPGQLLILLTPQSPGAAPTVVEAECEALEVVHAADSIRVEFRVLRWGANSKHMFQRIGLRD